MVDRELGEKSRAQSRGGGVVPEGREGGKGRAGGRAWMSKHTSACSHGARHFAVEEAAAGASGELALAGLFGRVWDGKQGADLAGLLLCWLAAVVPLILVMVHADLPDRWLGPGAPWPAPQQQKLVGA
eukprot:3867878-Rhodomonas_salina.1